MQITTLFHLLGLISKDDESASSLDAARKIAHVQFGVPESICLDDKALVDRMRPALEQRGFLEYFKSIPIDTALNCHTVAGAIGGIDDPNSITIDVVCVNLAGQEQELLCSTGLTVNREFAASFSSKKPKLVRINVKKDMDQIFCSEPKLASNDLWIEWSCNEEPVHRPGRFDIRQAILDAALIAEGIDKGKLKASGETVLLSALSQMTGLRENHVLQHAIASELSETLKTPAPIIGSLINSWLLTNKAKLPNLKQICSASLRANGGAAASESPNPTELAAREIKEFPDSTVEHFIERAINSGELSSAFRKQGQIAKQQISMNRGMRHSFAERKPHPEGHTWQQLLTEAGVPADLIDQVSEALSSENENRAWEKITDANVKLRKKSGEIRDSLKNAALAGQDSRVISPLRKRSPRTVARLHTHELRTALNTTIPDQTECDAICKRIQTACDQEFPGDALIRRRHEKIAPTLLDNRGSTAAWKEFVDAKGDSFHLVDSFIDQELANYKLEKKGKFKEETEGSIRAELHKMQRAARVARHGAIADALLENGYESAQQIAFSNYDHLVSNLKSAGFSDDEASKVYRRACAHYAATVEKYLKYNLNASSPSPRALGPSLDATLRGLSADIPSLSKLFGPQDYGVVEDWESVTSPSAYLVDLLVWLNKGENPLAGTKSAYNVFNARRPEISKVLFSRNNTEVLVPYIDIVCELLEKEAARILGLNITPIEVLQTRLTQAENRAYPEHINTAVYDKLPTITSSFFLPFDLSLEEIRAYLPMQQVDSQKITRRLLIEVFGQDLFEGSGTPSNEAINYAAEILGLNRKTFDIISQQPPTDSAQANSDQIKIWKQVPLSILSDFMGIAPAPLRPRDHLSYDEVLSLFATNFVNPNATTKIVLSKNVGDNFNSHQRDFFPALDAGILDRIHRFLRLACWNDLTFAELDLFISGVCKGVLDIKCLIMLAAFTKCKSRLALDSEELISLFRDFQPQDAATILYPDGTRSTSRLDGTMMVYRKVFLQRTDATQIPEAFTKFNPKNKVTLDSQEGLLCACLGISAMDYDALVSYLKKINKLPVQYVNFPNLSALYRYSRLAQVKSRRPGGANRTLRDLIDLWTLLGDPLQDFQSLLQFIDNVDCIDEAAISIWDVRLLCGTLDQNVLDQLGKSLIDLRATTLKLLVDALPAESSTLSEQDVTNAITESGSWLTTWLKVDTRYKPIFAFIDNNTINALLDPQSTDPAYPHTVMLKVAAIAAQFIVLLRISAIEASCLGQLNPLIDYIRSLIDSNTRNNPANIWASLKILIDMLQSARNIHPEPNPDKIQSGSEKALDGFWKYCVLISNNLSVTKCQSAFASAFNINLQGITDSWKAIDTSDTITAKKSVDVLFLKRVRKTALFSMALGVVPSTLAKWAKNQPDSKMSMEVRNAAKSTLSASDWLTNSSSIQNKIRGMKRNALVDYLLSQQLPQLDDGLIPALRTMDDFPSRYLIDVEMEACRETSRIAQAASAIQLLVERCLMGLEPDIVQTAGTNTGYWGQWEWRKRYQVWVANKMIYLYPQNFMNINARSNESPLFKEFKKKVLQDKISDESVSVALETYLEGLEKISRLKYEAVSLLNSPDAASILGLVASSGGNPPTYYYRRFMAGSWEPWEEVILGPTSSPLALAQGDNKSWLVWPVITDLPHPNQSIPPAQQGSINLNNSRLQKLSYVRFAWTMRNTAGVWSPVKIGSRAILMTSRDIRGMVINVFGDTPNPGAFKIDFYTPYYYDESPDLRNSVFCTGSMNIVRDVTSSILYSQINGFADQEKPDGSPKWQDHYREYILSNPNENEVKFIDPWPNLHFDGNLLLTGNSGNTVLVVRENIPGIGLKNFQIASIPSPFTITKPSDYLTVGPGEVAPDPNAFVISGGINNANSSNWALLLLSKNAQELLFAKGFATTDKYLMIPAYHPFASDLLAIIKAGSLSDMFAPEVQITPGIAAKLQRDPLDYVQAFSLQGSSDSVNLFLEGAQNKPNGTSALKESLDFDPISPYSLYNYEMFFYAPLLVAVQLSRKMLFKEAQRFYHLSSRRGSFLPRPSRNRTSSFPTYGSSFGLGGFSFMF